MSMPAYFKFRLYVAGDAANSMQAVSNLTALCQEHLPERYEIEIIDVFREPKRAMAEGVLLTPLLVRVFPEPSRRIVGDLGESKPFMQILELRP